MRFLEIVRHDQATDSVPERRWSRFASHGHLSPVPSGKEYHDNLLIMLDGSQSSQCRHHV